MTTTNDNPKPKRRRFAFRLRTLLIVVALLSVPLGWVGYSLRWIEQRREAFAIGRVAMPEPDCRIAPGWLWFFGEQGWGEIWCQPNPGEVDAIEELFPEACVSPLMVPQGSTRR